MVVGTGGGDYPHQSESGSIRNQRYGCSLQMPSYSDLFPPTTPLLLKVPQAPKVKQPSGEHALSTWAHVADSNHKVSTIPIFSLVHDRQKPAPWQVCQMLTVTLLATRKAELPSSKAGACTPCMHMHGSPTICFISIWRKSPCTQVQDLVSPIIRIWRRHVFPLLSMC